MIKSFNEKRKNDVDLSVDESSDFPKKKSDDEEKNNEEKHKEKDGYSNVREDDNNLSPRFNQSRSNPLLSESLSESLRSIVSEDRKGILLFDQKDLPEDMEIDISNSLSGFEIVRLGDFDILKYFENKRKVLTLIVFGNESLRLVSEKKDIFTFTFLEIIEFDEYDALLDLFPLKTLSKVGDGDDDTSYDDFLNKLDNAGEEI